MTIWITIALFVFYVAYKARPAHNKQGKDINAPNQWQPIDGKSSLIIGTYNIQTGKDVNGKRDIKRSAELIKNADIVGIQEVYGATWLERCLGKKSQTEQLAFHSDFGWLFAATRLRWFREHRGNALLSRIPVHDWSVQMLPDQTGKQYRNLITMKTYLNGKEVAILITHLHTKKGRETQFDFVLKEFQQHEHAVLLGDFNNNHQNSSLQALLKDTQYQDAIEQALPNHQDKDRIDWIITKGVHASEGFFEAIGISDHPYYQVTLSIK
jgi:endonuclease/exonuclease/phosphatase family metal-dependent hydrolase